MNSISMSLKAWRALLLVASVWTLAPLAVLDAQTIESQPPQKELIGPNLEPFAEAYKKVSKIHAEYTERIVQEGDPTQSEALQQEANQKMNQAVVDHGLTIGDYNSIFQKIESDPALKEEFRTVLNRTP